MSRQEEAIQTANVDDAAASSAAKLRLSETEEKSVVWSYERVSGADFVSSVMMRGASFVCVVTMSNLNDVPVQTMLVRAMLQQLSPRNQRYLHKI